MNYIVRPARDGDESQLRALWSEVFGDGDDFLDPFFSTLYPDSTALVCDMGGKIISSVYLLPVGDMASHGMRLPCTMIYALGTAEEYRNIGCASSLMDACDGGGFYILRPASEKLFGFYRDFGYRACFYFKEDTFTSDMLSPPGEVQIRKISAAEYNLLRNRLLHDIPHVEYSGTFIEFESFLAAGNMFRIDGAGFTGAAAVEKYLDCAYVKELIVPPEALAPAAEAVAAAVPADKYVIRSVCRGGECGTAFGMAKAPTLPFSSAWYGFALD